MTNAAQQPGPAEATMKYFDDKFMNPKIGDVVVRWGYRDQLATKHPITRVTKTLIEVDGSRYTRGRGERVGQDGGRFFIEPWTDEGEARLEERNAEVARAARQDKVFESLRVSTEIIERVWTPSGGYLRRCVLTAGQLDIVEAAVVKLAEAATTIGKSVSESGWY